MYSQNKITTLKMDRPNTVERPRTAERREYSASADSYTRLPAIQEPLKPQPTVGALNHTLALAISRDDSTASQDRLRLTPVVNSFIRDAWHGWSEAPITTI